MTKTKTKPKPQLSSRLMIRLLVEQRAKLKALAAKKGVADSALGRIWILEKLGEAEQ